METIMKKIDARGLECPKPVILIKKALEEADQASIVVDNQVARDNVKRFGENNSCQVVIIENNEGIELQLRKNIADIDVNNTQIIEEVAVLIKSNEFGQGDPKLGAILMKSFLVSLLESNKKIKTLIFMNKGVYLTTDNLEAIEILKEIEKKGASIFSCGTCLDFYELKAELKVGQITNMYSSVDALVENGVKVISI